MSLPNICSGGLGDADVVAERLRHLVDAVEAFQQRHRQHHLRFLAVRFLQLPPDQQVELLVGAAELDVGLERHRVVALHQRVQEFVHGDRLPGLVALGEIVALEHPGHRVPRRQLDHAGRAHLGHPGGIELHAGQRRVEDLEDLRLVGFRVGPDFIGRQRRPRRVAAGRITDQAGEVPDQEDHLVAESLEHRHAVDQHGVPEVQVGRGRVETRLDLAAARRGPAFFSSSDSSRTSAAPRRSSASCWSAGSIDVGLRAILRCKAADCRGCARDRQRRRRRAARHETDMFCARP